MRIKAYRVKKLKDGCVLVTPVGYTAQGRALRLSHLQVKSKNMEEAAVKLRTQVAALKVRGQ